MADKTLISLTKTDPFIYVTVPISEDDCIGSSLPFINFNFKSIDNSLSNIEYSAKNMWNGASEYIINNSARWDTLYQDYTDAALEYNKMLSTIEQLSGDWLTPVSLMYPNPLTSISVTTLSTWANTNYPINPFSAVDPYCFEYIVGQELYVFFIITRTVGSDVRVNQISAIEFSADLDNWVYVGVLSGY